jgi:hypothetical protein
MTPFTLFVGKMAIIVAMGWTFACFVAMALI